MIERDELLVIPEAAPSGFVCPVCLAVAIGKTWASHAKYCPNCGQHIKISSEKFSELKEKVMDLSWKEKEKCCRFYSVIAPEGADLRTISAIYPKRLDKLLKEKEQIDGQMDISDFIGTGEQQQGG